MSAKILISTNKRIINKIDIDDEGAWYHFANSFQNVELTLNELADSINQGFAVCAQHTGKRTNNNFTRTNALFVDIDEGLSVDDALAMPFVQQYASLLYTTTSHTTAHNRFRLMFQLQRTIDDAMEMSNALRGLIQKFGGDEACKDACRGYFGHKGCNPILLRNILPNSELDNLISYGENKNILDKQQPLRKDRKKRTKSKSSPNTASTQLFQLERDHKLKLPSGAYAHLHQLPKLMSVHCPFHIDNRPSAFVIENKNAVRGVHCHRCKLSFWPKDEKNACNLYNFYSYEQFVLNAREIKALPTGSSKNKTFEEMKYHIGDIQVFNSQYIDKTLPLQKGITFMRSPKGSGKTEWLSEIVKKCEKENKKILLIGHRRSLIIGLAKRLGITCYIFHNGDNKTKYVRATDRYAVCVDSIPNMLIPKEHNYDVIIIDESEQVLTHATAKTVKEKRRTACRKMFHYLRNAESVILADADLDMITASTMWAVVGDSKKYYLYMNTYKEPDRNIQNFEDYTCLVDDLVKSASAGGRYFVSTNSKQEAEALDFLLRKKCNSISVLLVTSGTTGKPDVRRLLSDVVNEIVKYDVVIASPTMGTGIDITFPNKQKLIDGVYGFYVMGINTHFDIDQQLSRVRHPGFIKTCIDGFPCDDETNIDAIKEEMKNSDAIEEIIIGYNANGDAWVDEEYLNLYSVVTSVNRASKNNLKENFISLRQNNGWKVDDVDCELLLDQGAANIRSDIQEVKAILKAQKINSIVGADLISNDRYKLLSMDSKNRDLSAYEQNSMRRWEIENFYNANITHNLVELDDGGRYRDKIRLLETYLESFEILKISGISERKGWKLLPDRNFLSTKKSALHELLCRSGVSNAKSKIDLNCKITDENLKDFSDFCQKNYAQIQSLLGINVAPKDLEQKPVSTLSRILKSMGLRFTKGVKTQSAGEAIYTYELDKNFYDRAIQFVHRRRNARDNAIVDKRVLSRIRDIGQPTVEAILNNIRCANENEVIVAPQKSEKIIDFHRANILFKRQEKTYLAKERLNQKTKGLAMRRDFIGDFNRGVIKPGKTPVNQKSLSSSKSISSINKRKRVETFVKY